MILLPAIDLYEGKAVRLLKGDYREMTVYSGEPASVAAEFQHAGAQWVHMVDLEGARNGTTPNFGIVARIARESGLCVEIGGGVRSDDTVARYLDAAALGDRAFLERMVARHGERIAVGVDCRDGFVATHGWTETSSVSCEAFCAELERIGVQTVVCTDIACDGAMRGANRALYQALNERFSLNFIASGGVSSLEDVRALREAGLYGAILGKAYYTGAVDLKQALEVAK